MLLLQKGQMSICVEHCAHVMQLNIQSKKKEKREGKRVSQNRLTNSNSNTVAYLSHAHNRFRSCSHPQAPVAFAPPTLASAAGGWVVGEEEKQLDVWAVDSRRAAKASTHQDGS